MSTPLRWQKRGQVFRPIEHKLSNGCREFAQSPQAVVFADFVRIYFSTRASDRTGKFLSHIAYVDMDKRLERVIAVADQPVLALGDLGCFDEHGIFPINPVKHGDRIYAYTCGWSRRAAVSVETSIGLAFSDDQGKSFRRYGTGPILTASLHEPFLVGDAFVQAHALRWHMWYIYGLRWMATAEQDGASARVYKIGHAVSEDGVAWQRDGLPIIADKLDADECQALPTVAQWGGRYHMVFCYRHATDFRYNKDRGYRLGYATSEDLATWTRDDAGLGIDVSPAGWDSDMMCYPHLFECDERIYLLYNGNEFGRHGFGVAVLGS